MLLATALQQIAPFALPQERLLYALARYRILAHRKQLQGARRIKMKASNADSVSAGLGLIWLLVALGLVLVLAQRAPALEVPLPAEGRVQVLGAVEAAPMEPALQALQQHEQRALAEYIARRWRIADSAAASFVSIAYRAGQQYSVDPVLILSVMAIESRYNPVAESDMGAKGLMQVIPRFHMEKLSDRGGEEALLDPEVNIHVGAQILREYYRRFGDQELALQMYAGAFDEPTSQYAGKVFAERARLEPVRQRARKQQTASAV
jgi:soluble lytic murein transglycosylase-like protein